MHFFFGPYVLHDFFFRKFCNSSTDLHKILNFHAQHDGFVGGTLLPPNRVPISSRFLRSRPPLLFSAPNQKKPCYATRDLMNKWVSTFLIKYIFLKLALVYKQISRGRVTLSPGSTLVLQVQFFQVLYGKHVKFTKKQEKRKCYHRRRT